MLGKLMKHELHATARLIFPFYIILFLTSIFFSITEHYSIYNFFMVTQGSSFLNFITTLSSIFFVVSFISVNAVVFVLMIYRFYKNYMTDEGYLMFTLPVKTGNLIWSKLHVATIWTIITVIVDTLAILIALLGVGEVNFLWNELLSLFSGLLDSFGIHIIVWGIEVLLTALISIWTSYLLFYAAITLGHSFSNHKILWSIVFYIAFNAASQTISTILMVIGVPNYIDEILLDSAIAMYSVLTAVLIVAIVVTVALYILSHIMLKRKLNLQ